MFNITVPEPNQAERAYVLHVILRRWLGQEFQLYTDPAANVTSITVPGQSGKVEIDEAVLLRSLLDAQSAMVNDSTRVDPGTDVPPFPMVGSSLPVLYHLPDDPWPSVAAARIESTISIHLDVLGTVFALLTGLESRFIEERDDHDRTPLAPMLLHRRGLVEHPVVDELVELLWAALISVWPWLSRPRRESKTVITHDVDQPWKYGGGSLGLAALTVASETRKSGPGAFASIAKEALAVRRAGFRSDPFFTFDQLMDIAEEHGVRSEFYFIARYQRIDGTPMSRYKLTDQPIQYLLRRIDERGHRIGLHAGYDSHADADALTLDKEQLLVGAAAAGVKLGEIGGRHHYLRWDPDRSPACWEAAGLAYDSSVGNSEHIGFRAGTCKTYPLWDSLTRRMTSVEERPMICMDTTIEGPMGLINDCETRADRLLSLKRLCEAFGGDFSYLVHNNVFARTDGAGLLISVLRD
jgi:hypothetical protein